MPDIRRWLTDLGKWTTSPWAFALVVAYGAVWFMRDRASFSFDAIAILATWLMTLVIQRAEHRDTQAIHAKLDELLHADANASNALTTIDRQEPEDIEKHRADTRRGDDVERGKSDSEGSPALPPAS